jgi:hypothetical protein
LISRVACNIGQSLRKPSSGFKLTRLNHHTKDRLSPRWAYQNTTGLAQFALDCLEGRLKRSMSAPVEPLAQLNVDE